MDVVQHRTHLAHPTGLTIGALAETRRTGYATFFSRTRNKLWMKGETSGNTLLVTDLLVDCDEDTLLVKVKRQGDGNVCHTGARSCFSQKLT